MKETKFQQCDFPTYVKSSWNYFQFMGLLSIYSLEMTDQQKERWTDEQRHRPTDRQTDIQRQIDWVESWLDRHIEEKL